MKKSDYVYFTHLSINDCIRKISTMPWEFEDVWSTSVLWYKCQEISPVCLLITFTGGQFCKFRRTEYMMVFSVREQTTVIEVYFQKELLGLPSMTSTQELDAFMRQKILAKST